MVNKQKLLGLTKIALIFLLAFFAGRLAASRFSPAASSRVQPEADNWGLSFQEEGQPPIANASVQELEQYEDRKSVV